MRKFLIPLMAASMLVPAAAQAEDGDFLRGMRNHAERSSNKSDDNSARSQSSNRERSNSDRPARAERAPREDRAPRADRVERVRNIDDGDRGSQRIERVHRAEPDVQRIERIRRADRDVQQVEQVQVNEPVQRTQRPERRFDGLAGGFARSGRDMADGSVQDRDGDRGWRRDRDGRDGDWRRGRDGRDGRDGDWRRDRDGRDWRRDRDGRNRWDRDWRRDRRYDWSSYRHRYGSLFRLGRYYDPYGWGYRRFSIGFSLWPSYYSSRYWINDPWQYRLPYAPPGYRWIRYYDDALLVDTWSGQVVDVIHNFFW